MTLYGTYVFVKESSGYVPAKGAQILLKFISPNIVSVVATKPGTPSITDIGHFSIEQDMITLDLPGLQRSAKKASFRFDGKQLILPIMVIEEGEGTSTWEKIDIHPNVVQESIGKFRETIMKGKSRLEALQVMANNLAQNPSVDSVEIAPGRSLLITYKSGYQEFFLSVGPLSPASSSKKLLLSSEEEHFSFFNSSRTTSFLVPVLLSGPPSVNREAILRSRFKRWLMYEPEPISKGDAPKYKFALIISAFHTLPVLIPGDGRLKYMTFRDKGEDLTNISEPLERIGYQVAGPYIDTMVTVNRLYELFNKSWGVVYFNSHGGVLPDGDFIISTGHQVPVGQSGTHKQREEYLNNYLKKILGKELAKKLQGYIIIGFINDDVPFIAIRSGFFEQTKGDFSSSLVFINGCDSAKTDRLRKALNPRAFVGWIDEIDMELGGDVNGPFWKCIVLKTRTAREAMDFAKNYLLEVKEYAKKLKIYGKRWDPNLLAVYRQGKGEYEKVFTPAQRLMLMAVREYAWRQRKSSGKEDLMGLVNQLYQCTDRDINSLAGKPFCRKAFVWKRAPTKEIDEVKGELCGYGGSVARFTLVESKKR